jgi:hypothetical protein
MRSMLWSYLESRRFPREMSTFEVRRFFTVSGDDRHVFRELAFRALEAATGSSMGTGDTRTGAACVITTASCMMGGA